METLSAYFLRGCFDNQFNANQNRDILRLIISAVRICMEGFC